MTCSNFRRILHHRPRSESSLVTYFAGLDVAFRSRQSTNNRALNVSLLVITAIPKFSEEDQLIKVLKEILRARKPSRVEGAHQSIDLGRAYTIPPIYKRSTASNISFERGGESTVQQSCNGKVNPSSASHGVNVRSASTVMVNAVVTDSLETPVMEMKEPWGSRSVATTSSNEEDNTVFSIWEENYQDLSDFCMDAFQGQCALLTGESEATGILGTKIDDKSVSTTTLGTVNVGKGIISANKTVAENGETMEGGRDISNTQMIHQYKPKEEKIDESVDVTDVWLDSPKSSIALRTDEWIKLVDNGRVDEPLPRENWDVINTFENTGLNSFDLLSYLCDDNIQSPDGSVSTDSASVSTHKTTQHEQFSNRKPIRIDKKPETITSSSSSSSSADRKSSAPSSSKKTRGVSRSIMKKVKIEPIIEPKVEPLYIRTTSRGKKRAIESDSNDGMSDCSYRESREKNNEASRKSRMNKKAKESEMMSQAGQLERDNRLLKMKVEELEKIVTSMRAAILRSALKK